MALPAPPKVFWEDEEYAVRPARDNDECRAEWWAYMQILGWVCKVKSAPSLMRMAQAVTIDLCCQIKHSVMLSRHKSTNSSHHMILTSTTRTAGTMTSTPISIRLWAEAAE
jgi:hypothetical protein